MTHEVAVHMCKGAAGLAFGQRHECDECSPVAACEAWNELRGLADQMGPAGERLLNLVRTYAQRQYEAARDELARKLEAAPSLYDRTGDIKDLNCRVVTLEAIRGIQR